MRRSAGEVVPCQKLKSSDYHPNVTRKFTAILHRGEPDEAGFWATCPEVPGANGQGQTAEECLEDLKSAIQLLLEDEREDPQAGD